MAFGNTGPITNVLSALATSIGLGLVIGGFFGGAINFASTRSQRAAERWALIGGYLAGFAALVARAIDMVMKSFV